VAGICQLEKSRPIDHVMPFVLCTHDILAANVQQEARSSRQAIKVGDDPGL
jgi:hypothetical protein